MRRTLTAAIACLLFVACPVFAADVQVDGFGPAEIAAADRISLIGPAEATSGDEVTLRMTGAPPLDLTLPLIDQLGWLMGDDRMYCYLAAPGEPLTPLDVRGELVFSAAGATMQPLLRVQCGQPGEYRVLIDWNHGQNQLVDHRLTVRGDEDDPPDPPIPPISGDRLFLMMLETGDKTASQETVILAIRKCLESHPKVSYRQADPSQVDQAPWVQRCLSYLQQHQTSLPALVACALPEGKSLDEAVFLDACSFPGRHQEAVLWVESRLKGDEP